MMRLLYLVLKSEEVWFNMRMTLIFFFRNIYKLVVWIFFFEKKYGGMTLKVLLWSVVLILQ